MKKAQRNGAQNRKKKRAREETESRQKEALNTWIKRCRVEVEETRNNEAAENSSDISMESEHNNNSTVSSRLNVKIMIPAEKKKKILILFSKETILAI